MGNLMSDYLIIRTFSCRSLNVIVFQKLLKECLISVQLLIEVWKNRPLISIESLFRLLFIQNGTKWHFYWSKVSHLFRHLCSHWTQFKHTGAWVAQIWQKNPRVKCFLVCPFSLVLPGRIQPLRGKSEFCHSRAESPCRKKFYWLPLLIFPWSYILCLIFHITLSLPFSAGELRLQNNYHVNCSCTAVCVHKLLFMNYKIFSMYAILRFLFIVGAKGKHIFQATIYNFL